MFIIFVNCKLHYFTTITRKKLIVSISTSKGGQGKTTTIALLASALSQEPFNYSVVVIDLDNQKSLVNQRRNDLEAYQTTEPPFDIIDTSIKEMEESINQYRKAYDLIFLDSAGSFDIYQPIKMQSLFRVLYFSDVLLIPFSSGNYNLESTISFLKMAVSIRENKENTPIPLRIYGFINLFESRLRASKELLSYCDAIANQTRIKFVRTPLKRLSNYDNADTITSLYKKNASDTTGINFKSFVDDIITILNNK